MRAVAARIRPVPIKALLDPARLTNVATDVTGDRGGARAAYREALAEARATGDGVLTRPGKKPRLRSAVVYPSQVTTALEQLRATLDTVGYAETAIAQRLGVADLLRTTQTELPVYLRRLGSDDRLSAAIRLFYLGQQLAESAVKVLLAPTEPADLEAIGILCRDGDHIGSRLKLTPHAGLYLASDPSTLNDVARDHVLGWNVSARTLAALTVRRPADAVLDLGSGCGTQALLAARHAQRVVAADLNPRAVWMTGLNSRLNGLPNIECRQGDLYEPVVGDTFDLIVSNPPFVVSPAAEYMFRDSGREADGVSRQVVVGAAERLREGGFAHVLCNWIQRPGEPWSAPLLDWVQGKGCDALLLLFETLDPLTYAADWNRPPVTEPERFPAVLDRWLAYYRANRIEAIGSGAVLLRRRSGGANWTRTAEAARAATGSASAQILRLFAAQDELAATDNRDALLGWVFEPVDGHRVEQVLSFQAGAYQVDQASLVLDEGIGVVGRVDALALQVLLRLDGQTPLRQLIDQAAEETDLDRPALAQATLQSVEHLFGLGLLRRSAG